MNLRTLPWFVLLLTFGAALGQTGALRVDNDRETSPMAANQVVALTEVAPTARLERTIKASSSDKLAREIQQKLVALPFFTVFDNLFRLDDDEVTLVGRVANSIVKADAENAVKQINGVKSVADQIEVLPLSAKDGKDSLG